MKKDLTQQRREEIIEAAKRCFTARGIHATSMVDIAREFGMSTGHIYNYFPSKLAIIEEVTARGLEEFYRNTYAIQSSLDSYEKTLKNMRKILLPMLSEEHVRIYLELLNEAAHDPTLRAVLTNADAKAREHLMGLSPNLNPENPIDQAELEVRMATFDGIRLRVFNNPSLDKDLICQALAKRLYTAHEEKRKEVSEV